MLYDPAPEIPLVPAPLEPPPALPPISGFWRRFFAWVMDVLILAVIGHTIGVIFSSFLFSIGPYGRPIGLLFTIPYFGLLNSKIGGGQTIGKRILKIAVRSKGNQPIEVWRSIARISLLVLPALLNQWPLPIFFNPVVAWFSSLIIFGLGGAVIYTMVFNRKARQGIHDLLLGTYVVHLLDAPIESYPTTPRIHWIVTCAWMAIVAVGTLSMAWITSSITSQTPLSSLKGLYNILQADPRFFTVSINSNTLYDSNGRTSHSLLLNVWYKGKLAEGDRKEVAASIVKTVLDNTPGIEEYDGIQVKISSAYDIGIASANLWVSFSKSVEEWRKEIYPRASPIGLFQQNWITAQH